MRTTKIVCDNCNTEHDAAQCPHCNAPGQDAAVLVQNWDVPKAMYRAGNRVWLACTEKFYYEVLGEMPPIRVGKTWACSEPLNHTPQGAPVYLFFHDQPEMACRVATEAEIKWERIFVGVFPTGIVYADREREQHGDYMTLARLPFGSLVIEWTANEMPLDIRQMIIDDAATIQAKRGEQFRTSATGQYVTLGKIP